MTGSRAGVPGSRAGTVEAALASQRPGTSRPITSSGRFVRLGTASMLSEQGGPFIVADRLDLKKYAARAPLARVLCDFLLYHDRNPRKALELCAEATQVNQFTDWWWKARLGRAYYQLGLHRDAEKQFHSSLGHAEVVATVLELANVKLKLDQPLVALELYDRSATRNPVSTHLVIGSARTYDLLHNSDRAVALYKRALELDSGNIEALASLAAYFLHADQPEIALRMFRRLHQMGLNSAELWNNLGLCSFHASQYDTALSYLERALSMADDTTSADIWYNIGHVATSMGDATMASQAFRVALWANPNHAEAANNLAVLEMRRGITAGGFGGGVSVAAGSTGTGAPETAKRLLADAVRSDGDLHEALYNSALVAFNAGDVQEAFSFCERAVELYPEHSDTITLHKLIKQRLSAA
jgi:tetratricopeptide repeat protein 8